MYKLLSILVSIVFFRASSQKHSRYANTDWTTVLLASASSDHVANISDMYFNREGKMETSQVAFTNLLSLNTLLEFTHLYHQKGYRSCLLDAWNRAEYCETNSCSNDEDLLRVYGVRVTLWNSAILRGTRFAFYPISMVPNLWFDDDHAVDMDMCCDDCRFIFDRNKMVIVDKYDKGKGVFQVDWSLTSNTNEFLYVRGYSPKQQPMPLSSDNGRESGLYCERKENTCSCRTAFGAPYEVISAKYLSFDLLLENQQILEGNLCQSRPTSIVETTPMPKPFVTTDETSMAVTTEKETEKTSMPETPNAEATTETTATVTNETITTSAVTTTTVASDTNTNQMMKTTCVSVLPDGTVTNSSFQVLVITDHRYTKKLVESIYSHLVIPKPILSRYRRRLSSAPDKRTSSYVLGALACAFISLTVGLVFLLDLSSWRRHWPVLKRSLC